MLNIPETVKALYKADGVRKGFRVQFPNGELQDLTNDNIVQESVQFTESICSQDVLKFGLTEASVIEFETVGAENMYGMTIKCSSEIDLSSLSAEEIAEIEAGTWDGELIKVPVGKNLFNYPAWAGIGVQSGTAVYENNGVTLTATGGDCYTDFSPYPTAARIPVTEGVPVTLSWETDDAVHGNQIIFPNGEIPGLVAIDNYYSHSLTYTPAAGDSFVTIRFGVSNAGEVIHYKNIMVEYGATPTDFEPYTTANSFRVPYGLFRVESCPRDHQAMTHRRVQAYSIAAARKTIDLGTGLLWDFINADPNALLAAAIGTGMTFMDVLSPDQPTTAPDQARLFDSSGNPFLVAIGGEGGGFVQRIIFSNSPLATDDHCDFLRVDMSGTDLAAHNAFGVSVANLLTSYGWDLTYNASRKKIYANNEEALRRCQPWLFSPGIMYNVVDSRAAAQKNVFCVWEPINNGSPQPVICPAELDAELYPCGFTTQNNGFYISAARFMCPVSLSSESAIGVSLNAAPIGTVTKQGFFSAFPRAERLRMSASAGFKVRIQNTGTVKRRFVSQEQVSGNLQSVNLDSFDYLDVDLLGLAEGALEMNACFAKHSRAGGFEIMRLQTASPEAIPPGEYSQFWWDEYDVLPVGSVRYVITDGDKNESICQYQFSNNPSVYDMSDNSLILSMVNTTPEVINSLLAALFVPNLAPIAFTPIDLDMKGLPYLEAGDYLAVTAEDGTTAYSFNMRQEINGIQAMTATIESTSGQIIESE